MRRLCGETLPQRTRWCAALLACTRRTSPPAMHTAASVVAMRHFSWGRSRVFLAAPRTPRDSTAPPSTSLAASAAAKGKGGSAAAPAAGATVSSQSTPAPPTPPPLSPATGAVSPIVATTAPAAVSSATTEEAPGTAPTSQTSPPPPPPPLQDSVMGRLFKSWQQGVVASIGAVMGIGFLVYFLYTPVKEDTVHHTAVVASEALADARLKGQAVQLSKEVVLEVLRDPKALDATVDVVVQLLAREDTKIAVSSLLQSLFEDHYTQEVTKKFVLQVVQDPWIQDQLQVITEEQVRKLLKNGAIKTELSHFLLNSAVDSLDKPQLHYEVAKAMRRSCAALLNFWWC